MGRRGAANTPPTITVTTPVDGASFVAPATITIAATASDAGGSLRDVAFSANGVVLHRDTTPPFSLTLTNLPANSYALTATAVDNLGAHTSTTVRVTVTPAAIALLPSAPRALKANVTGRTLSMSWEPPTDGTAVSAYLIEAGSASGQSNRGTVRTPAPSFSLDNVPAGTYFLRVRSVRADGLSRPSNEVVVTINDATVTCRMAAMAPTAVSGTSNGTFVRVSWLPGPGDPPSGYILKVGSTPGAQDLATLNFGAGTTTVSGAVSNGTYFFRVVAVNPCGASQPSKEGSVSVGGPAEALPRAPAGLVQQVSGSMVSLWWTPPVGGGAPTSYVLEVTNANGNALLTLDTGNHSPSFSHGGVATGTYIVRVRARNATGVGPQSLPVTVTVTP